MVSARETASFPIVRSAVVSHRDGMHLRICSLIAKLAIQFDADIIICWDGKQANAASVLELLSLAAESNVEVTLKANGPGAAEAVEAIIDLL